MRNIIFVGRKVNGPFMKINKQEIYNINKMCLSFKAYKEYITKQKDKNNFNYMKLVIYSNKNKLLQNHFPMYCLQSDSYFLFCNVFFLISAITIYIFLPFPPDNALHVSISLFMPLLYIFAEDDFLGCQSNASSTHLPI